jgi:hypothetical protein
MNRLAMLSFFIFIFMVGAQLPIMTHGKRQTAFETKHPIPACKFCGPATVAQLQASVTTNEERVEDGRPTPEEIWQGIKSAAQEEVYANSPLIIAPKFVIKPVGSNLHLTILKADVGDLGFRGDPYDLPFKKQILVESLRRALSEAHLNPKQTWGKAIDGSKVDDDWQNYLVQAEKLIMRTVVHIESTQDKNDLKEKLQEDEKQIDNILYSKVYEAVEQYAQRNQYNIIYSRGGQDIKKFSVSIITIPDGAKVWMMTNLVYRKQLITKADPSQWPWVEIVQNPSDLLGKYHYRAVWPDTRRAEGDIEIGNASPIKLMPQ